MDKKQLQQRVTEQRRRVRRRLTIRGVLSLLVVLTFIRCAFMQRYENMFVCVLSLVLLAMPTLIEKQLAIDIPPMMEAIIYCFIYAAEIMGEINSFYTIIPGWDTMLHTINGFLVAAVGFCLVDLFNRSERFTFKLSPLFLAIVAFCFSMTVGVLWEFFEFTADQVMHTDMQKDYVVHEVNSVSLNPDGLNVPVHVQIESVIVNGEDWTEQLGGYLDIGLIDTMKDLQVNCTKRKLWTRSLTPWNAVSRAMRPRKRSWQSRLLRSISFRKKEYRNWKESLALPPNRQKIIY